MAKPLHVNINNVLIDIPENIGIRIPAYKNFNVYVIVLLRVK